MTIAETTRMAMRIAERRETQEEPTKGDFDFEGRIKPTGTKEEWDFEAKD